MVPCAMNTDPRHPLVTVIIPTYNRSWILSAAIDSVLTQSYPHFELLVVDDGSTDDTSALLQDYGGRIRILRQPNQGVSAARNLGIAAATGSLIAFLDSDDLWLPAKLARQVDFFRAHPQALICQTQETWVRNGVRVNPKKRHRKRSGMIFEPSLELCLVSPSAVMLRRELLDVVGCFDVSLPACEDYDLWLRIGSRWPIFLMDEPLILKHGGHADQLSNTPSLDKYRIRSIQNLLDRGGLTAVQSRAAARVLIRKCRIYANGCHKRGRADEAAYYRQLADRYGMSEQRGLRMKEPNG